MYLFNKKEKKQIIKFFKILNSLKRSYPVDDTNYRYKGHDKNNPHISMCEQEVFVNRVINKWLTNRYLILYMEDGDFNIEIKKYLYISRITLYLGYSTELEISYFDYAKPAAPFNHLILTEHEILSLEGKWCKTNKKHKQLAKFFELDIPDKEFVYKAYDFSKYPKRRKKNQTEDDIMKMLETTYSIKAKTMKGAEKNRKAEQEKYNGSDFILTSEIINIK